MRLVLDASVTLKWFLGDSDGESEVEKALALLNAIRGGGVQPLQPAHWQAEVAAVLARKHPSGAEAAIDLLAAMELEVVGDVEVLKRAAALATQLDHHLFDTLYHALALESGVSLVTADDVYAKKAKRLGGIVPLREWG